MAVRCSDSVTQFVFNRIRKLTRISPSSPRLFPNSLLILGRNAAKLFANLPKLGSGGGVIGDGIVGCLLTMEEIGATFLNRQRRGGGGIDLTVGSLRRQFLQREGLKQEVVWERRGGVTWRSSMNGVKMVCARRTR